MASVTVRVPATTANLGPGFDCVGLALGLRNELVAEPLDTARWTCEVRGVGEGELPRGPKNLALKAVRHLFSKVDGAPPGVSLRQHNTVPLASGLGSSSTAIVSGLVAANALCGKPFGERELLQMAVEIEGHPDNVAPALLGGLVVSVAEGGRLGYVRFDPPEGLTAVVAVPAQRLSTEEARRALPSSYSKRDTVFNLTHAALLVASLVAGDWENLRLALRDRVHQPYRLSLIPGASKVLDAARKAGAIGAVLSGAGPSLLALCDGDGTAVATAMEETWREAGVDAQARVVPVEARGAVVMGG